MPRKKNSENVNEVVKPMKDDAFNPPVEDIKTPIEDEKKVEKKISEKKGKKIISSSANLINVRTNPNGEVLFRLKTGTPVIVEEEKDGWCKIVGYVMTEFVKD